MRNILNLILLLTVFCLRGVAQDTQGYLDKIFVNSNISTHFICAEPIEYVDISSDIVVGDLPTKNILRIKPGIDSLASGQNLGVVTIVGNKFQTQFAIEYSEQERAMTRYYVTEENSESLLNDVSLSEGEMQEFSKRLMKENKSYYTVKAKKYRTELVLNNLFSFGDYFFIDLSVNNNTNIKYDIDQIRFKINDKKIVKATNSQSVEIKPVYSLYNNITDFRKWYRNVFVFKKFTFPDEKVFTVELAEDQYSGRAVDLNIEYIDVLNADTF